MKFEELFVFRTNWACPKMGETMGYRKMAIFMEKMWENGSNQLNHAVSKCLRT